MSDEEIRSLLHTLSNHLNTANLNTHMLKRFHTDNNPELLARLEAALRDAQALMAEFHRRLEKKDPPAPAPGQT